MLKFISCKYKKVHLKDYKSPRACPRLTAEYMEHYIIAVRTGR
ncbi:MAG TPA: hypothetical protein VFB98_04070 [Candidatus Deferrimicrobium sp.]|nr:hypothetical protein [Candidatus Deferrimicrobium sp.]